MNPLPILLLAFALSAGWASGVWANEPAITLKQALITAQTSTPGKVLDNELVNKNGSQVYRVKILTPKGVIKTVFVGATKGELVK
mgnify:FL=1